MEKNIVVGQDLTPDWLKKYYRKKQELDRQLIQGLEHPGKGLTLDQLQTFLRLWL
ncbi:MAG: hypothetical protein UX54_C0006G0010 [Parcubacteria group bacterium GW2011_GWA2_46_39]|nr:MAG: hypothetical protein UX54_C0006G0010 [Parcubacteria group bacterium GW2011_GWA2_46_39]